jgi:hypothetical protein
MWLLHLPWSDVVLARLGTHIDVVNGGNNKLEIELAGLPVPEADGSKLEEFTGNGAVTDELGIPEPVLIGPMVNEVDSVRSGIVPELEAEFVAFEIGYGGGDVAVEPPPPIPVIPDAVLVTVDVEGDETLDLDEVLFELTGGEI